MRSHEDLWKNFIEDFLKISKRTLNEAFLISHSWTENSKNRLFNIRPNIRFQTNIRTIIPNICLSYRIFGRLFIFYFFQEFMPILPFIRIFDFPDEYSADYSFFYFIYIYNIYHSITSHPIAFYLLDWYCYKRPGRKNWDPRPAGDRASGTNFFEA